MSSHSRNEAMKLYVQMLRIDRRMQTKLQDTMNKHWAADKVKADEITARLSNMENRVTKMLEEFEKLRTQAQTHEERLKLVKEECKSWMQDYTLVAVKDKFYLLKNEIMEGVIKPLQDEISALKRNDNSITNRVAQSEVEFDKELRKNIQVIEDTRTDLTNQWKGTSGLTHIAITNTKDLESRIQALGTLIAQMDTKMQEIVRTHLEVILGQKVNEAVTNVMNSQKLEVKHTQILVPDKEVSQNITVINQELANIRASVDYLQRNSLKMHQAFAREGIRV